MIRTPDIIENIPAELLAHLNMSVSTASTYADYLISQGETVIEIGGIHWMIYHGALIPAAAMPVYIEPAYDEVLEAINKTRALFLRYTSAPGEAETDWWHVVCRKYDFKSISSNTRSKIRRGLKRLEIKQAVPEWLAEHGYDCHVRSYDRYKNASPYTRDEFRSFILSLKDQPIFEVWTCSYGEELVGYILCLREADGVFMHTIDLTTAGLHNYAAYAMIHCLLEYYVHEQGIPVSNGSRSIAHATEMQEFLHRFQFKKEYSQLHVIYRQDIAWFVRLLYQFRKLLERLEMFPVMHKISAILFQEEIVRRQRITER